MSLTKHASFEVLAARIAQAGESLMRTAHRAEFDYVPKVGFLYVRSRAISSRCNDNYDEFPAKEIKNAYRTFIGKPVFVNHHNANHRRARGVIIDAALHEDVNPDGTPDTWVEVLMEVDAVRFPKLAEAIVKGHIERTSMGTDVAYSVCSACGNKASSPVDYCQHIPRMKGKRIYRTTASGTKEGVLVREICYGLGFFENSLLVEEPADPTAYFLGVDTRGVEAMQTTASKAAAKTSYTVTFPDGTTASRNSDRAYTHVVATFSPTHWDGRTNVWLPVRWSSSEALAQREANSANWSDWASQDPGRTIGVFPVNGSATASRTAAVVNKQVEVGDFVQRGGGWQRVTAVEPNTQPGPDFSKVWVTTEDGTRMLAFPRALTGDSASPQTTAPAPTGRPIGWDDMGSSERDLWDERHRASRRTAKDESVAPSTTEDPSRYDGISIKKDEKGYYVHTHRARSKSYPSPEQIPDSAIKFIESTGSRRTASRRTAAKTAKTAKVYTVPCSGCAAPLRVLSGPLLVKGTRPSNGIQGRNHVPAHEVQSEAYLMDSTGEDVIYWDCPLCGYADSLDLVDYTASRHTAITFDQGGRVTAPEQVDTLREEQCPVCGETDSYDGQECKVCGFITPPDEFGDPDLSKAKQVDLHQDADAGSDRLQCDSCGATFSGGVKVAVVLDKNVDATDAQGTDTAMAAGETCPECSTGTLQAVPTPQDGAEAAPEAPEAKQEGLTPEAQQTAGTAAAEDVEEAPGTKGDDKDSPPSDDDEEDDEDDDDKPDFLKKKKPTAARHGSTTRRSRVEMRPTLKALSDQQIEINRLNATLAFVVKAAGLENHPRTAHLFKQAEDENPAQPSGWANPAGGGTEAPAATTEEASTPAATDSPENQGGSPLTDVTPAATTSVESTETVLEEPLDLNEQDPTKPVAGTEDLGEGGRGNAGTNRTETEVRIGDPNQGDAAFNDGGFLSGTAAAERVMASLRLARLRIQAGIEAGDDLVLSQAIAASAITDEVLDAEIATLSKVVTASQARRPVSRSLVPQAPAGRTAVRARPSLSAEAAVVVPPQEISAAVTGDEVAFE